MFSFTNIRLEFKFFYQQDMNQYSGMQLHSKQTKYFHWEYFIKIILFKLRYMKRLYKYTQLKFRNKKLFIFKLKQFYKSKLNYAIKLLIIL